MQHRWSKPRTVALAAVLLSSSWPAASADLKAADRATWAAQAPERDAGAVPPNQRREIEVVWRDIGNLTRSEANLVANELRSVFAIVGVAVKWKQTKGSTAAPADGRSQVQVVLLPSDSKVEGRENVLGAAEPKASAAWVYFPSVSRSLGLDPARRVNWTLSERRDLARALGRVTAHEITHVLAPTLPHAEHGLMAPHLKRSFLCDSKVVWDPASARAVVEGGPPAEETVAAADVAAAEG